MSNRTAVATASASSGGVRGGPTPRPRRSRRQREVRLDDELEGVSLAKIVKTMGFSHVKSTKKSYSSYHNSIHEWFWENHPETCNGDGTLCAEKFRSLCSTPERLIYYAGRFRLMISTRTHIRRKLPDGTPAPAGIGTLRGYRAAFSYLVWIKDNLAVPAEWSNQLTMYFKSLNNEEGMSSPAFCSSPAFFNPRDVRPPQVKEDCQVKYP